MPRLAPRLHLLRTGTEGPTLVFLAGLAGTTRYWKGRLGNLEKNHRVLLIDPLGFRDAPKPRSRRTVDRHLEALFQTLEHEPRFVLVRHSMGSLLASAYAARHPEQVERLVLLSISFSGSAHAARRFFTSQPIPYGWFFSNMALAAVTCVLTRRLFGRLIPYFRPNLPADLAADVVKHSWRSFTSSWEVIGNYGVKRDANARNLLPVGCLHGDPDVTAPLAGALCLANATENWQMRVLSGMDHHPRLRALEICQRVVERESDLRPGSAAPATANQRHLHNFPPIMLRSAGESR